MIVTKGISKGGKVKARFQSIVFRNENSLKMDHAQKILRYPF
jgi:hypothetical protein